MNNLVIISIVGAVIALAYALYLALGIKKQEEGNDNMKKIAFEIRRGAMVFLKKEYKILSFFIIAIAVIMFFIPSLGTNSAILFIAGAIFSVVAGFIGVWIATIANVRVANACREEKRMALNIAFSSGSVLGLTVVGLGVLGIAVLRLFFRDPQIIYIFGFGASLVALSSRIGGGIFKKSASVGASSVGKIESGIQENDLRNPASIANNAGDNVGEIAGMSADLFESYIESIIAAMVLGSFGVMRGFGEKAIILPLLLAIAGIISFLIGNFFITSAKKVSTVKALSRGIFSSSVMMAIFSYFIIRYVIGVASYGEINGIKIFLSVITGLIVGIIIRFIAEYNILSEKKSAYTVSEVAVSSSSEGRSSIIRVCLGMVPTVIAVVAIFIAILTAYNFAGFYGIAISAVGMISILGIILAIDTCGHIASSANGIAEMAYIEEDARKRAKSLSASRNKISAIGKGFSIGYSALIAIVLFVSFREITGIQTMDFTKPAVILGMLIGVVLIFLFLTIIIKASKRSSKKVIEEVKRQFIKMTGIMEHKEKPDYERCISISADGALKEIIFPVIIVVVAPVLVGFFLGAESLSGFLAGSIGMGFLMMAMVENARGLWGKADIIGDNMGDSLKGSVCPSLNILIKFLAIIAIIIAPLL